MEELAYREIGEIVDEAEARGIRHRALLLTPLALEMDAVLAHLDPVGSCRGSRGTVYECGVFRDGARKWLAVVTRTGAGTHHAQNAAETAYSDFGEFDLQIVVGVAGSRKTDVPIGSVVASELVYWPYVGKYDEEGFSGRPRTVSTEKPVLEIAAKVQRDRTWQSRILGDDGETQAEPYDHEIEFPPRGIVAPSVSVEAVQADRGSSLEEMIRERYGDAHVVEMEGYGAYIAAQGSGIPCIMIRGVSDETHEKREAEDAHHQPIAARHAAAFAFELMAQWAQAYAIGQEPDASGEAGGSAHADRATGRVSRCNADDALRAQAREQLRDASLELLSWPSTLPGGGKLERPELRELVERIEGSETSTTALLGDAGSGKSALLATLAARYVDQGWTVLAIKGDLVDVNVASEAALQEQLALDSLPSALLSTLARDEPVLLILDQLDALAGYLDLKTQRLSVLLNLVRKLGQRESIHIVLSSRTFEFEHDVRLKAVSTEEVSLELPSRDEVLAVLAGHGIHAAGWPEDAQEVMRTPQALATYLRLRAAGTEESFTSYQEMLEHLWNERVLGRDGGPQRGRLAIEIAEAMAEEESLQIARARFDDRIEYIRALESENVLVEGGRSLRFTHQTVFEHVLARSFAAGRGRLASFVLERQSSLFVRPKVWIGLNYLRAADINACHAELETLWRAPGLRSHLRLLLIDFLGRQSEPTNREALLMDEALQNPDHRWHAFQALTGSRGWFERFRDSRIADCVREGAEAANHMIGVLGKAWLFAADDVANLLQRNWVPFREHDSSIWWVLQEAVHWSEAVVDIACTVVRRTQIAPHLVDDAIATLGVEQPVAAFRLARARLDRELADASAAAQERKARPVPAFEDLAAEWEWLAENEYQDPLKKLVRHPQGWESLPALAEKAPADGLSILWPWFDALFSALEVYQEELDGHLGYRLELEADYQFVQEDEDSDSTSALLSALQRAAERIAKTEPDAWVEWVSILAGRGIAPTQRLIAHTFALFPEGFASLALRFLLEDPRRFFLGSLSDPTATTARVIEAASRYWTEEEIAQLKGTIDGYRPAAPSRLSKAEERLQWHRIVRSLKASLISAFPKERLEPRDQRHVDEELRAFPEARSRARVAEMGWVGSMMNSEAMELASDDDLINAFRTVPDATAWSHPRRFMKGGNIQLAQQFGVFAAKHPARAERLLASLKPNSGTRAAGKALESVAAEADADFVLGMLHRVVELGFDGEEFRMTVCRLITRLIERQVTIDERTIALLEGWLASPLAKERAEANQRDAEAVAEAVAGPETDEQAVQENCTDRSPLWAQGGMYVVPEGDCQIVQVLIRVRRKRQEVDQGLDMLERYLDREQDPRVWVHLLHFVPVHGAGSPGREAAFLQRLFAEVPSLVGTKSAAQVLARSCTTDGEFVNTELERWRESDLSEARQAYGEIVGLAVLREPELAWASERLEGLVGNENARDARAGAALTAAHFWMSPENHERAGELLNRLLNGDREVWRAACEVFRLADELRPGPSTVSLLSRMETRAERLPRMYASFIAERLSSLLPFEAHLVGRVTRSLIVAWRSELADASTRIAHAAPELMDLAVTLHRLGPETREIGTELFETLIEANAWDAGRTRDEIDNRFRELGIRRRPRLARHRRRRRTRQSS